MTLLGLSHKFKTESGPVQAIALLRRLPPELFLIGLFLLILSFSMGLVEAVAQNPIISFSNDRVTIVADNVPLGLIAEQLSRETGMRVYLDRSEAQKNVSFHIWEATLEKTAKNLAYPFNYALIRDIRGNPIELRIFNRQMGSRADSFQVFNPSGNGARTPADPPRAESVQAQTANTIMGNSPPSESLFSGSLAGSAKAPAPAKEATEGPSPAITGDRAFSQGIWVTQRMQEAARIGEAVQTKADQTEATKRDAAAVTSTVQVSKLSQEGNGTALAGPPFGSNDTATRPIFASQGGYYQGGPAYSGDSGQLDYLKYLSMQQAFSNYVYYQQRAVMENMRYTGVIGAH